MPTAASRRLACRSCPTLERMPIRTAVKALGLVALVSAAFARGAVTAVLRGWGSPLVFVMVENKTMAKIRSVSLAVTTCGSTSKLAAFGLALGQTQTVRFPVCGEGGYELEAVLVDGRTLKSKAYVESGYSVSEHVDQSRIRSQTKTRHF